MKQPLNDHHSFYLTIKWSHSVLFYFLLCTSHMYALLPSFLFFAIYSFSSCTFTANKPCRSRWLVSRNMKDEVFTLVLFYSCELISIKQQLGLYHKNRPVQDNTPLLIHKIASKLPPLVCSVMEPSVQDHLSFTYSCKTFLQDFISNT